MNDCDLYEQAKAYYECYTKTTLSRMVAELRSELSLRSDSIEDLIEDIEFLQEQLEEYQRIYGTLDPSDYLRR